MRGPSLVIGQSLAEAHCELCVFPHQSRRGCSVRASQGSPLPADVPGQPTAPDGGAGATPGSQSERVYTLLVPQFCRLGSVPQSPSTAVHRPSIAASWSHVGRFVRSSPVGQPADGIGLRQVLQSWPAVQVLLQLADGWPAEGGVGAAPGVQSEPCGALE